MIGAMIIGRRSAHSRYQGAEKQPCAIFRNLRKTKEKLLAALPVAGTAGIEENVSHNWGSENF